MYKPMHIPLSYREKNLINVLARTSPFAFWEIESIYRQGGSIDGCIRIMEHAQETGMSLQDALLAVPIVIGPDDDVPQA